MALEDATNSLAPVALGIVALAVVVGVGSIVLTEMGPAAYQDSDVISETDQPATPFPTNYTVAKKSSDTDFQNLVDSSVEVVYYDSSAGTNTSLQLDDDFNVFETEGVVQFLNTSDTTDFDSATDQMFVDYQYEYKSSANEILSTGVSSLQTFSDFFTVIIVIAVAAVLFLMLRVVRGAGKSVTA